jgi:branched-chain amino acid transport system substrate-binding protein
MANNRRKFLAGAIAAVAVLGIALVVMLSNRPESDTTNVNGKDKEVIRIGAILPLTGPLANLGFENKAGIELALERINQNGKRLEVVFEDGKGDATSSVSAMKMLEMQGIDKVILSTTQTTAAILSLYNNDDKFFFSANCLTKGIIDNTNNAMRLYFSSENETSMMANHIIHNRFQKIATFRINTESGLEPIESLKQKIKALNPNVKFYDQTFEFSDKDYRAVFTNIKNFEPDVLVVYSYPDQWKNIVKQLAEQNMRYPILANSGFGLTAEHEYYKHLEIMNLIVFPSPRFVMDKDKPEVKQLIQELKDKYGIEANFNVLYLYDNIMVIADNLEYASNNKIFINSICQKEYRGITGKISFSSNHDITPTELLMVRLVNGRYEAINE